MKLKLKNEIYIDLPCFVKNRKTTDGTPGIEYTVFMFDKAPP